MTIFEKEGLENLERVLEIAREAAIKNGIKKIVIPTVTGRSVEKAFEILGDDIKIIAVTHCYGFEEENENEMSEEKREEINRKAAGVVTAAHAMGTIGRAVRKRFGTYQVDEIAAETLRIFGQGVKVAAECSMMACDAGYIRTDELIISCGGSSEGLDTAVIIKPANTHNFFNLRVREILCKPKLV